MGKEYFDIPFEVKEVDEKDEYLKDMAVHLGENRTHTVM